MPAPYPIPGLEIIGYANRLNASMLPAVVPPVFRVKAEPDRILLPAFVIHQGFVCDATERLFSEVRHLADAAEITLFKKPLDAQRDFELWIGSDENPHYEPIPDAKLKLREIALEQIRLAEVALRNGDFAGAEDYCRIALCADDKIIDSLAISAAIARRTKDPGSERLVEKLALGRVTQQGFRFMTDGFSDAVPMPLVVEKDLLAHRSMSGMAAIREDA